MIHSNAFINFVDVVSKTYTLAPNGQTVTAWTVTNSLWACILELNSKNFDQFANISEQKLVKIIFRGRRVFDVEATVFRSGENIYKPIAQSFLSSRSDTPYAVIICHKLDDVIEIEEAESIEDAVPPP